MPKQVDESSIVAGVHAVEALLRSAPGKINHLVLLQGGQNRRLHDLQKIAEDQNIRIHQLPKTKLDYWFNGPHQGILAFCNTRSWDNWDQLKADLITAKKTGYNPLIIVPAAMEDPHNLGACIRSAVCFGADAVLTHNKGGAGLTPAAAKAASGALEHIAIAQTGDIEKELKIFRDEGFAIIGLEAEADVDMTQADFTGPIILVVGGEDRGIPPHIRRACTRWVKIPMVEGGAAHSFNASVALSLLLYEANRSTGFKRLKAERPKFIQDRMEPELPPTPELYPSNHNSQSFQGKNSKFNQGPKKVSTRISNRPPDPSTGDSFPTSRAKPR
jgi:23S rRNA (guanosine2251-2'-O)-methyltransferase